MAFSNEFVYGYHGCSRDVAEMLLSGKDVSLNSSENDYDWLGSGIYFWEEAPHRALEWAQLKFGKDKAAVLGAKIRLGHCLNLMDVDSSISDPKAARAFARAFCAVSAAPCRAPSCIGEELTDPASIRAFFARRSSAKASRRKVAV